MHARRSSAFNWRRYHLHALDEEHNYRLLKDLSLNRDELFDLSLGKKCSLYRYFNITHKNVQKHLRDTMDEHFASQKEKAARSLYVIDGNAFNGDYTNWRLPIPREMSSYDFEGVNPKAGKPLSEYDCGMKPHFPDPLLSSIYDLISDSETPRYVNATEAMIDLYDEVGDNEYYETPDGKVMKKPYLEDVDINIPSDAKREREMLHSVLSQPTAFPSYIDPVNPAHRTGRGRELQRRQDCGRLQRLRWEMDVDPADDILRGHRETGNNITKEFVDSIEWEQPLPTYHDRNFFKRTFAEGGFGESDRTHDSYFDIQFIGSPDAYPYAISAGMQYAWPIYWVPLLCKKHPKRYGQPLRSPVFNLGGVEPLQLWFYPEGNASSTEGFCSLKLLDKSDKEIVRRRENDRDYVILGPAGNVYVGVGIVDEPVRTSPGSHRFAYDWDEGDYDFNQWLKKQTADPDDAFQQETVDRERTHSIWYESHKYKLDPIVASIATRRSGPTCCHHSASVLRDRILARRLRFCSSIPSSEGSWKSYWRAGSSFVGGSYNGIAFVGSAAFTLCRSRDSSTSRDDEYYLSPSLDEDYSYSQGNYEDHYVSLDIPIDFGPANGGRVNADDHLSPSRFASSSSGSRDRYKRSQSSRNSESPNDGGGALSWLSMSPLPFLNSVSPSGFGNLFMLCCGTVLGLWILGDRMRNPWLSHFLRRHFLASRDSLRLNRCYTLLTCDRFFGSISSSIESMFWPSKRSRRRLDGVQMSDIMGVLLLSGICSSLGHVYLYSTPVFGASGAISGLLYLLASTFPNSYFRTVFPIPGLQVSILQVCQLFVLTNLYFLFFGSRLRNIAWAAHLFGFGASAVYCYVQQSVFKRQGFRNPITLSLRTAKRQWLHTFREEYSKVDWTDDSAYNSAPLDQQKYDVPISLHAGLNNWESVLAAEPSTATSSKAYVNFPLYCPYGYSSGTTNASNEVLSADNISARRDDRVGFIRSYGVGVSGNRASSNVGNNVSSFGLFGGGGGDKSGSGSLDELIEANKTSGGVLLVDFYATWCRPCDAMKANLRIIESRYKPGKLVIYPIDVDENAELCASYEITALPTILLYSRGNLVKQVRGLVDVGSLMTMINEALDDASS
ncbi:Thioredoxin [Babesia sp. Xinjiang]|uniref:Thioredoxin n=1 Tax=Babesia sp. Xinjiang TaxID=462227 RepID=UPI000A25C267|nr:Thioredoxin [Babesia sp. Xinjiang]ORM42268.1 Thioredoxin [Babesia sp. Xinjiang]